MATSLKFELRPPTVSSRRPPKRNVSDLLKLQKAAQQISSILDLDQLLDRIVNETAVMFGCLEASIWLHDAGTNEMVLTGVRGCTMYLKGARLKVGEQGLIGKVAASGQISYTPDVRLDPTYIACEPGTLSEIDIPLLADGQVIGVFSAVHPEVNGFPPEQVKLLEALTGHISVAVHNACAFQRERQEREQMTREAEEARAIQQALFPKVSPSIRGFTVNGNCVPARAIGGDWYDYVPLEGGRWALVLADVSGKGMAAALLMSGARGILRSLVAADSRPSTVLARLNRVLVEDFPSGKFVTMVYAVLDPAARTLTFANAGHPLPLMLAAGRAELLDCNSGLPLGVAVNDYPEKAVSLELGARVLLYTDGITEAANSEGEEFGTLRLQSVAQQPEVTIEHVLNQVRWFAGARGLADDATVLLIGA